MVEGGNLFLPLVLLGGPKTLGTSLGPQWFRQGAGTESGVAGAFYRLLNTVGLTSANNTVHFAPVAAAA